MAWKQCHLEVESNIKKLVKDEKISVAEAIRRISREIGIPVKTLERWIYPGQPAAPDSVQDPGQTDPPDQRPATPGPGGNRDKTQAEHWGQVLKKTRSVLRYIQKNCPFPADISAQDIMELVTELDKLGDLAVALRDPGNRTAI